LPFGYAPSQHFPEPPATDDEKNAFAADVVFVGGADADRVPLVTTLIRQEFTLALYGGYWERYAETRATARGHIGAGAVRKAVAGARVALCLVRRANRDGSAMRTFEVAAMGACMLAEYTDEHRAILGEDGEAVVYFRSPEEMVARLRWLLANDDERRRLGRTVRERITARHHTYADRLQTMLSDVRGADVAANG
jgi:spore maturation protein CgeB